MKAVREEEVQQRGKGFVKQVNFKPGVMADKRIIYYPNKSG